MTQGLSTAYNYEFASCSACEIQHLIGLAQRERLAFSVGTEFFSLKLNGGLIGFCGIVWYRGHCKFKNDFVLPEFRRQGWWRYMTERRLALARSYGCRYVKATCTPASLPGYLQMGAEITGYRGQYPEVRITL